MANAKTLDERYRTLQDLPSFSLQNEYYKTEILLLKNMQVQSVILIIKHSKGLVTEINIKSDDRQHYAQHNLPKQLCARENLHVRLQGITKKRANAKVITFYLQMLRLKNIKQEVMLHANQPHRETSQQSWQVPCTC